MFSQTLVVGCEKGPKSFFRVFYKDKTNLGFVNWLVELFVGVFQPLGQDNKYMLTSKKLNLI
jgi:hypothetical protein